MSDMTQYANRKCSHPDRIHYLGGELYVCFECWLRLLFKRYK